MPPRQHPDEQEKRERQQHRTIAEDERGWAGQRGQRPANEEEKNYRAGIYRGKQREPEK
jgi:hypothetical protein